MAPEYGATIGFFPIDAETLNYLRLSGRDPEHVKLVEAYAKAQGLFRTTSTHDPKFSDTLELDLSTVEPSLAGPRRPQDRVPLGKSKQMFHEALPALLAKQTKNVTSVSVTDNGNKYDLANGSVVIAAITSCTNTSNPSVMIAAGILAKKAVERGLEVKPWVKTSLAPGSRVVTDYLKDSGLMPYLERLKSRPGGLRLHDLHRQQRPSSGARFRGGEGWRSCRGSGFERQSKFRRTNQSPGPRQLPGVSAAGRCVRARRQNGYRFGHGTSGLRQERQGRLS